MRKLSTRCALAAALFCGPFLALLIFPGLDAEAVELWTDVDGVLTADPRVVPGALPLPTLAYDELMELSHFGARVVHAPSVHPARSAGVPLLIRNTLRPEFPGTRVGRAAAEASPSRGPVRGLASIGRTAVIIGGLSTDERDATRRAVLDGFGLIAFASLLPIITVLGYGQLAQWVARRRTVREGAGR